MFMDLKIEAVSHDHRKLFSQEGAVLEFDKPLEMDGILGELPECEPGEIAMVDEARQITVYVTNRGAVFLHPAQIVFSEGSI